MSFESKEALLAGLIGGVIAAMMAFAVNHFLVPFPQTAWDNAVGHGISGLLSGLLSGFIGVMVALKKVARARRDAA